MPVLCFRKNINTNLWLAVMSNVVSCLLNQASCSNLIWSYVWFVQTVKCSAVKMKSVKRLFGHWFFFSYSYCLQCCKNILNVIQCFIFAFLLYVFHLWTPLFLFTWHTCIHYHFMINDFFFTKSVIFNVLKSLNCHILLYVHDVLTFVFIVLVSYKICCF